MKTAKCMCLCVKSLISDEIFVVLYSNVVM